MDDGHEQYVRSTYPMSPRGVTRISPWADKFLGVIYHTLKNDWVFEHFPNFVLAS